MKLKPRHVFAALLLVGEAPILAPLVAGWVVGTVIFGTALAIERARSQVRAGAARTRERLHGLAAGAGGAPGASGPPAPPAGLTAR